MMSLLRLIPMPPGEIVSGTAMFEGNVDLLTVDHGHLRSIRGGRIGFIFQDPLTSLNPVLTVGYQLEEALRIHTKIPDKERAKRAQELLELVGIPAAKQRLRNYPHELSGGMRQRVMIAMSLACSPQVIIADEPTTALDVTIQAQIIEIVSDLREQLGTAVIWITHDLGVVAGLADRVMVMYGGQIVEEARSRTSTRAPPPLHERAARIPAPTRPEGPAARQHQRAAAEPLRGAARAAASPPGAPMSFDRVDRRTRH
jgi:oligopeptide transport system ATP-binding protein